MLAEQRTGRIQDTASSHHVDAHVDETTIQMRLVKYMDALDSRASTSRRES